MVIDGQRLDRRQLEDAYFQYATLRVAAWYPDHLQIGQIRLHSSAAKTIQEIVTVYHGLFMQHYS